MQRVLCDFLYTTFCALRLYPRERLISDISMIINNDKKNRGRFPRFYVFPRKRLSAHMWNSRGHVTRVKQVSRIASGEGMRAGCREMISLLRESRERSVERNGRRPDSAASSCAKPWRGNQVVYASKRRDIQIRVWPIRRTNP